MRQSQHITHEGLIALLIDGRMQVAYMIVERAQADVSQLGFVVLQKKVQDTFSEMEAVMRLHRARSVEEHIDLLLAAVEREAFKRVINRKNNARTRDRHPQFATNEALHEDFVRQQPLVWINP